jgi:ferredoxin like protein
MTTQVNVKEKLGWDTIKVDEGKHISVDQVVCKSCKGRYCLHVCPAQVYTLDKENLVVLDLDGCLECGTCLIACTPKSISWKYPQGGFGVQFKCG